VRGSIPRFDDVFSRYFFGRDRETVEVIGTLPSAPDKVAPLIGNSGVGKSSLAQACVLAALMRQGWPDKARDAAPWPAAAGAFSV
jgi:hypothetical protein